MAILKTTYGSTGSVSYEQAESVLHLGDRKIRIYGDSEGGIHERELSPGDRVEIIDGNAVIHAENCPDVAVDEGGITVKNESGKVVMKLGTGLGNMGWHQVAQSADIDIHLHKLYKELFEFAFQALNGRSFHLRFSAENDFKNKTKEIARYLKLDCQ